MPGSVRHTRLDGGGFCRARVSKRALSHTYDFTAVRSSRLVSSRPPRSPLLRSSLRLLNVRQVIYTRGFTAREILRKALTRAENRRGRASTARCDARLPRTKNRFFFLRSATSYELRARATASVVSSEMGLSGRAISTRFLRAGRR